MSKRKTIQEWTDDWEDCKNHGMEETFDVDMLLVDLEASRQKCQKLRRALHDLNCTVAGYPEMAEEWWAEKEKEKTTNSNKEAREL